MRMQEPPLLSGDVTFAEQLASELAVDGGPPGAEAAFQLVRSIRAWTQEQATAVASAQETLMARVTRTEQAALEAMRRASRAGAVGRSLAADLKHGARDCPVWLLRRNSRSVSRSARPLQLEFASVGTQLCAVLDRRAPCLSIASCLLSPQPRLAATRTCSSSSKPPPRPRRSAASAPAAPPPEPRRSTPRPLRHSPLRSARCGRASRPARGRRSWRSKCHPSSKHRTPTRTLRRSRCGLAGRM
jgi:hypothetical protein